jgi:hypothetical protein
MKSLLTRLEKGIKKLNDGAISSIEMDEIVQSAREIHERLLVIRYKLYEQQIFPERIHVPIDIVLESFDTQTTPEMITPIEINLEEKVEVLVPEEPAIAEIVEEEVRPKEKEEQVLNPREVVVVDIENPLNEPSLFQEIQLDKEEGDTEPIDEAQDSTEVIEETEDIATTEEVEITDIPATEDEIKPLASHTEESYSIKELEFLSLEKSIVSKSTPEKLETLIGSFTLNDKLLFINSLFDGSSDAFAKAVKALDACNNMNKARAILAKNADEYHWEMDNDTVEDFVQRICQRHSDALGH